MRLLLIFILLLSSVTSFSQEKPKPKVITKELYVEFVDTIEYLFVRVDINYYWNEIKKTKVLEEFTTLKDTSKISFYSSESTLIKDIDTLKKASVYSTLTTTVSESGKAMSTQGKMKFLPVIVCYRFINKDFDNYQLTENEKKLIPKYFKNGTFKYNMPWKKNITKREGNKQYDYLDDYISEYDIDWYNDDRYTITLINTNNPKYIDTIGEKSYVQIIKVLNDKSYLFRTTSDGNSFTEIFTKID